jgi:hypothetical protein
MAGLVPATHALVRHGGKAWMAEQAAHDAVAAVRKRFLNAFRAHYAAVHTRI